MIGAPHHPAWQVWADQLQASGDPRGELITLERIPESAQSQGQRERLATLRRLYIDRFDSHARALLPGGWMTREVRCWRFGYVLELSLGRAMPVPEQPGYSSLFGAEELRCLSSLHLPLTQRQLEPLLHALEQHRPPLTTLQFFESASVRLDGHDCQRLWAALPSLQQLIISASTSFAHINHPGLRSISLLPGIGGRMPDLDQVVSSKLPSLTQLTYSSPPWDPLRLDFLTGPGVLSLLNRLKVVELPSLFSCTDSSTFQDDFRGFSDVGCSATFVTLCPPDLDSHTVREHLPLLDFQLIDESAGWPGLRPTEPKREFILSWPCGQPNLDFPLGVEYPQLKNHLDQMTPEQLQWALEFGELLLLSLEDLCARLANHWVKMNEEQQLRAADFIVAIEATAANRPTEIETETLREILRSLTYLPESVVAALDQHRACCPTFVIELRDDHPDR